DAPALFGRGGARKRDFLCRQDLRAELGHTLAVDEYPSALDVAVGLAPRAQALRRHQLGNADFLHAAMIAARWLSGGGVAAVVAARGATCPACGGQRSTSPRAYRARLRAARRL